MPLTPAGRRPSIPGSVGDHEGRIRAIERQHLLGVQSAYYAGVSGFTLPDSGVTIPVDMQGGQAVLNADALTDDPEIFGIGVHVGGVFDGIHSCEIRAPGRYEATISAAIPSEKTDTTPKSQSLVIQTAGLAFFAESGMNFGGWFTQSFLGKQDIKMSWMVGDEGPLLVGLGLANLRGAATGDVTGQLYLDLLRLTETNIADIML